MQDVVFKFRRPSGSEKQEPSAAMTDALRRLGETEEMQSLIARAKTRGKLVAIEVYQSRSGAPLLIHFGGERR
jgi:hypothetical protein